MQNEDLIEQLSAAVRPVDAQRWPRRVLIGLGLSSAIIGLAVVFGLSLRPDLSAWTVNPAMQMKSAYTLGLSLAGTLGFLALSQPLGRYGVSLILTALFVVFAGCLALNELVYFTPEAIKRAWMAPSWAFCMGTIWALSLPVLTAAIWLMRQRAPVHPLQAGLACGLLAGALAASAYSLHCTEDSALFLFSWYTLGLGISGLTGAIAGHFALRWRF